MRCVSRRRQDAVRTQRKSWRTVHPRGAPPTHAAGRPGARSGGASARVQSGRDRSLHTHCAPQPHSLRNTTRESTEHDADEAGGGAGRAAGVARPTVHGGRFPSGRTERATTAAAERGGRVSG